MSNPVRLIAGNQIGSGHKLPSPLRCPAISLTGLLIIQVVLLYVSRDRDAKMMAKTRYEKSDESIIEELTKARKKSSGFHLGI
eukprot:scaffold51284_cov67-Attheya_sp.AAC.1